MKKPPLFNEIDLYAADWLRDLSDADLIPRGEVDGRSIRDLQASDLLGRRTVHLFAGIGGWPLALRLARWPDDRPVWTGSCPCQPYSSAGKGLGDADPRNLWPEMFRLIRECRPDTIFGEQVESAVRHGWLDRISADLEGEGYAVGSAVLGAHSAGADHIRQRLFWVGHAQGEGLSRGQHARASREEAGERPRLLGTGRPGGIGGLADAGRERIRDRGPGPDDGPARGAEGDGPEREWLRPHPGDGGRLDRPWDGARIIPCRDGKARRIGAQPGDEPLAHGIPARRSDPRLGHLIARLVELGHSPKAARGLVRDARRNRVGRLKGYGNAIVPRVAAMFVRAAMASLAA